VKIPTPILKLIESFERLPGIGPKTAQRLTFYLLHFPEEELQKFADSLVNLKRGTKLCEQCHNVSEKSLCSVCSDSARDRNTILVVSSPLDAFAIEKTGFKGVYHVLHGIIDPLNNIGPEELFVRELKERILGMNETFVEVILATNTSMEGEATAMYISKMLRDAGLGITK
jgi:recombination protein RecR